MSDMDGIESAVDKAVDKTTNSALEAPTANTLAKAFNEEMSPSVVEKETEANSAGTQTSNGSTAVDSEDLVTDIVEGSDPIAATASEATKEIPEALIEEAKPEGVSTEVVDAHVAAKAGEELGHTSANPTDPVNSSEISESVIQSAAEENKEPLFNSVSKDSPAKHVTNVEAIGSTEEASAPESVVPENNNEIDPEGIPEPVNAEPMETVLHDNFQEGKDVTWELDGTKNEITSNHTHAYDINEDFESERLQESETSAEPQLPREADSGKIVSETSPCENDNATQPATAADVEPSNDLVEQGNGVNPTTTATNGDDKKAAEASTPDVLTQAPSEVMPRDQPTTNEELEQVDPEDANGHTGEPELDFVATAPAEAMPWDKLESTSDPAEAPAAEQDLDFVTSVPAEPMPWDQTEGLAPPEKLQDTHGAEPEPELDFVASAPAEAMPWDQPEPTSETTIQKNADLQKPSTAEGELDFLASAPAEAMPWDQPEPTSETAIQQNVDVQESSTAEGELDFLSSAPAEAMPWDQPTSPTPLVEDVQAPQDIVTEKEEKNNEKEESPDQEDKFDFLEEDDDILWDDVMDDDLLEDDEVASTPAPQQVSKYVPTSSSSTYAPFQSVSPALPTPQAPAPAASVYSTHKKTDAYDFPADILPQKLVTRPSASNIYASHTSYRPPSVTGSIDQALLSKPQNMAPPPAKTVKKKQSFFEELPINPSFAKHAKHPIQDPYAIIETHKAQENTAVPPSADVYRSRSSTVKNPYAPPSFDKNAKARASTPTANQHTRNISITSASSKLSTVDIQAPPNPYAPHANKYAPPQQAHVPEAVQMPPNPVVSPFPQASVLSPVMNQYQSTTGFVAPVAPVTAAVPAVSVVPQKESSFASQYNPSNKYSPYAPNAQAGNIYGVVSPTQMSFPNGHQSKPSVDVSDLMPKPTISSKPVKKKNMPPPKKLYGRGPSASFGSQGAHQMEQQFPTGLQLLGQRQFPIFHFSASSKVAKLVPKIDPYGNMLSGVVVEDLKLNVAIEASLQSFPGPLIKGRTKKKDVEKWITDRISSLESTGSISSSLMLWKTVGAITSFVNKPGDFSSPEFLKHAVAAINPTIDVKPDDASIDFNELTNILRAQGNKLSNAHKVTPQTMAVIHQLLQDGEKQKALLAALHEHDWAMALLIANFISPEMFAEITRLYTEANFGKQNPVEQGLRFFLRSSQLSVESMAKDDKEWLASNFSSALPFVILNHPGPSTILLQLGEMFVKDGFPELSIICYMLSGLPFIPPDELQLTFDADMTIAQEIYEYVLLTSQNAPANLVNGFPHLVPLKLAHAEVLADFGLVTEGKRYADHIGSVIKSKSLPVSPKTAYSLQQLIPRLSQSAASDGGWFGSKIARPNLDRVWGQLDKSFSKFVAGEDLNNNANNNGGEGVFSKFSPAVSRTQSVVDLQAQATSSAPGMMYGSPMSNRQPELAMPNTPYSAPTIGSDQTTIAQSQGYSFAAPSSQQFSAPPPARPPLINSLSAAPRYAPFSVPASFSTSPETKKASLHSSAVDLYQQSLASKSFHDLPSVSTQKKPSKYAPYAGASARPMPVAESPSPFPDNIQPSQGPPSIASAVHEPEQPMQHPLPNKNFYEQIPVSPTVASDEVEIKKEPESEHEVEIKQEPVDDMDALSAEMRDRLNLQQSDDIRTSTPPEPLKAPSKKKSVYNPYAPQMNAGQQKQKKPNPYAPVMNNYKPADEDIKVKEEPTDYPAQEFDFYSYGGYHVPEPTKEKPEEKPEEQQDEPMEEHNNFGPMEDDFTPQDPDVDLDNIESTHAFNPMESAGYNNFGPVSTYSPPVLTPQPESNNNTQDDQFVDDVVEDEDDDDEVTEQKEEKKDDNANKKGWFSWLGKKSDEPKAIKAKLGEESAFYYDETLKRWVNKNAPPEEQAASGPPPPPAMKRKPAGDSSAPSATASPSPAPPSKVGSPVPPTGRPPVKKADSDIDGLLNMAAASGTRKTKRGPRRGYVDVMNK